MASLVLNGNTSGSVTISSPAVSGTTTLTLPATSGTVALTAAPTFTGQATIPTINLTGGQITFPATQSASADANTLDDYEEGTWTPTITFSGGNGNLAYATRVGTYTKIGRCLSFTMQLLFGETTATGYLADISGLPFAAGSISAGGGAYIDNFTSLSGGAQWSLTSSTSSTLVVYMSGTGTSLVINVASVPSASAVIHISGVYFTS